MKPLTDEEWVDICTAAKELHQKNMWHCEECKDPNYIPPSPEAPDKLHKAIESAKKNPPVYLESFAQYADDEDPQDFDLQAGGLGMSMEEVVQRYGRIVEQGKGIAITAYEVDEATRQSLSTGGARLPACGFTVGSEVTPGYVSPEFQRRLSVLRDEWIDVYDVPSDPMADWLFHVRKLNFLERCSVGWQLWKGGVAKYPWPVSQNKEFR